MEVIIPPKSKKSGPVNPEAQLKKARVLYRKYRSYRMIGIGLLFVGCITMGLLYNGVSGGDFTVFFENPAILLVMLVPFIPAAIIGMIAGGLRKKCIKTVKKQKLDMRSVQMSGDLRERTDLFSNKNV